jgi:ribonuclease HII
MSKKNEPPVDLWAIQRAYATRGYRLICGVDEAGRGPLAGPVCAAAVILPENYEIPGLNDSKQLTDKKRRELFPVIQQEAISYGIAFVDEKIIDRDNILNATFQAMKGAIAQLSPKPDLALIDGNRVTDFGVEAIPIVKGDAKVASIAAASILAKVARDQYMEEMDALYPEYGFAVHKGYGTKRHYAAVTEHGLCPIHRKTFFKKFYGEK